MIERVVTRDVAERLVVVAFDQYCCYILERSAYLTLRGFARRFRILHDGDSILVLACGWWEWSWEG